jgi:hypothetical protein
MAYFYAKLRWSFDRVHLPGAFFSIMDGTADRRHQYRVLMPWLAGLIVHARYKLAFIRSIPHLFFISEVAATFLLVVSFRYYLSLINRNTLLNHMLPLFLLYAMCYNFLFSRADMPFVENFLPYETITEFFSRYYPYDAASMLFITIGLILLYKRKFIPYYILLIVATFNKETSFLLIFLYLFTSAGKVCNRTVFLHFSLQLALWLSVKLILYKLFSGNYGVFLEMRILHNIDYLTSPLNYPYLISVMGLLWLPALLWYRLIKDEFTRRSILSLIPLLAWIIFFEDMNELRIYGELIPILLPATFLAIIELLKMPDVSSPEGDNVILQGKP